MIGLLGEYEVTLDSKGRFLLPIAVKKQLGGEETNGFVINRGFEICLTLFPMKNWEKTVEDISDLSDYDVEARQFRRYFLNGAVTVEFDGAGRLLLPKSLIEYAGLKKDVVLVCAFKKIEIWDKVKYQQLFDTLTPEAYSKLAQKVMAKKDDKLNG